MASSAFSIETAFEGQAHAGATGMLPNPDSRRLFRVSTITSTLIRQLLSITRPPNLSGDRKGTGSKVQRASRIVMSDAFGMISRDDETGCFRRARPKR